MHRMLNKLAHLCVLRNGIRDRKWLMPTLLILSSAAFEIVSLRLMSILSNFYRSVSTQNFPMFYSTLCTAFVVVAIISTLKSIVSYATDMCALQWRSCIVTYIQYGYGISGHCDNESRADLLDSVDQRVTQDTDRLTTLGAKLFATTAVLPGVLIFYAIYLAMLFGPAAPLLCVLYFLAGSIVSYVIARGIVDTVYQQERLEGAFRATHCRSQLYKQEIFLLRGEHTESLLMARDYGELVRNTGKLIRYRLGLNLFSNWFAYTGSIVNYVVVGGAIFYSSRRTNDPGEDTEASFASQLAEGSYACLYLISALSTLISSAESASEAAGLARRVCELLDRLELDKCVDARTHATPSTAEPDTSSTNRGKDKCGHVRSWAGDRSQQYDYDRVALCGSMDTDGRTSIEMSAVASEQRATTVRPEMSESVLLQVRALDVCAESLEGAGCGARALRGRVLVRGLSLQVCQGMRVLVTGPSGCGKSTLLRTVATALRSSNDDDDGNGYCRSAFDGVAVGVPADAVTICPQTPYLFKGTLRENLLYPQLTAADAHHRKHREVWEPTASGGKNRMLGASDAADADANAESLLGGPVGAAGTSLAELHRVLGAVGMEAFRAYLPQLDNSSSSSSSSSSGGMPINHKYNKGTHSLPRSSLSTDLLPRHHSHSNSHPIKNGHEAPGRGQGLAEEEEEGEGGGEEVRDWASTASPGEKQRLAVARALLRRPALALFDEISSALDEQTEHTMYSAIASTCRTFISFGHRSTLRRYHTHELQLRPDGSYLFGALEAVPI